jgi:hypothetical protein
VTIDQIVDVVAVGHRFVTTSRTVDVIRTMTTTTMRGCAAIWIVLTYFNAVLNNGPVFTDMMQMPIMQIVNVVAVLNACVFTVWSVLVIVVFVCLTHRCSPGQKTGGEDYESSIACMTPLVTNREMCASAKL